MTILLTAHITAPDEGQHGVTFETAEYSGWDYVLLTNEAGSEGTPVVVEKVPGEYGRGYRIRSTRSNHAGYDTWCLDGNDDIYLNVPACSTRWMLTPVPGEEGYVHIKTDDGKRTISHQNATSSLKLWLQANKSISWDRRDLTRFTYIGAH